jgi:hypothetical protein
VNDHVTHFIAIKQDISARKEAERALVRRALHDDLTGLSNRAVLTDHLERSLARSRRDSDSQCAILFIDLDHYLILDVVTYPGMVAGLILALPGHLPLAADAPVGRLLESARGLAVGGGVLWVIQFLGMLWYRRQGLMAMGLGDVKLAAFTGAFLGPRFQAHALFIAVVIGGFAGILLMLFRIKGGKDYIPFGPFLAAGAALSPFYGVEFYEGLMHMIQSLVSPID